MHRFFVKPHQVNQEEAIIKIVDEDVKHISKVLRLKEGQEIEICDSQGLEYRSIIEKIDQQEVIVNIQETYPSQRESDLEITLYQGLPKSTKMDLIIQKCTELGVAKITPIKTSRTIVKIQGAKAEEKKLERWQRIAYEAAKQSKRGKVPYIDEIKELQKLEQEFKENDLNIVAYENEVSNGLKNIFRNINTPIKKIGILIGPEGGFEEEEIQEAQRHGFHSISLGPRILRTETAGFTALTILMYHLGDLGGD